MKLILAFLLAFVLTAQDKTAVTAVKLTPGSVTYSKASVCASAFCTGGLARGQFAAAVNSDPQKSWRLVYDGKKAIDLFEVTGYTYTMYSLYVGPTKDDCLKFAATNGVTIPDSLVSASADAGVSPASKAP